METILYDLRALREKNEARRKRVLRRHRLFKVVEVIACIMGLGWTVLLLRSLLRHGA